MAFVKFTRPDDSAVLVNAAEVVTCVPVPTDGPTAGPLKKGTRINLRASAHQDVKELLDDVARKLDEK